jgi:hypothetical protein
VGIYLNILVGPHPDSARTVAVTADPVVVRAAVKALVERLAGRRATECSKSGSSPEGRTENGSR